MQHRKPSRRQLLQMGAAVGGSLVAGQKALALEPGISPRIECDRDMCVYDSSSPRDR